ncbi:KLTH0G19492p [Lachancea thermotolerans CBS 6340]|uniref:KLTH0G19492p n=1 Tax=Lachancea thermotolerans (strain ATCC 56472 / CBS 6340 / NRRL Y-8284) TaxID=559295 RepID=C5DNS7_LACTC|nr:KLTH0G19492p [Lachancea thermotolerans CBS 6340]CAR25438.1 KLTH0G19492p [Lachancea thermotolerans CBS 6340]
MGGCFHAYASRDGRKSRHKDKYTEGSAVLASNNRGGGSDSRGILPGGRIRSSTVQAWGSLVATPHCVAGFVAGRVDARETMVMAWERGTWRQVSRIIAALERAG